MQKCKEIRQQMALDLNKETVSNTLDYSTYFVSFIYDNVVVCVFFQLCASTHYLSG